MNCWLVGALLFYIQNPIGLQNYPSSENMASQMVSQLSNQQFQMSNQLNLEQNTNLDFNQPQSFPDVPPVSQSQVFMPQKPNLPFQNQRQNTDEEIRPSANTLQTEIQNDEPTNERSRPSQSAYVRQDSFPTTKLHGIQAGRPHKVEYYIQKMILYDVYNMTFVLRVF